MGDSITRWDASERRTIGLHASSHERRPRPRTRFFEAMADDDEMARGYHQDHATWLKLIGLDDVFVHDATSSQSTAVA